MDQNEMVQSRTIQNATVPDNAHPESFLLSGSILKDRAKGALSGKYSKAVTMIIIAGATTLALRFVADFIAGFLFGIVLITKELTTTSITLQQLTVLVNESSYLEQYMGIFTLIEYVSMTIVLVFSSVFNVGMSLFYLNVACGRETSVSDLLYGFRNQFQKSFVIGLIFTLISQLYLIPANLVSYMIRQKAGLPMIFILLGLFIVGLVIYVPLQLRISQSYLLLLDVPHYSALELIKLSNHIMKGQKGRLFLIQLSFLPLILLSLLSFRIGNLWLTPYINVTYAFFFLNLMQARSSAPTTAPTQTY